MGNFVTMFRILSYLERAMDLEEPDTEMIMPEAMGISEPRWSRIVEMMADEGLVSGIGIRRSEAGEVMLTINDPRITLKGLEYLSENQMMIKAAAILYQQT